MTKRKAPDERAPVRPAKGRRRRQKGDLSEKQARDALGEVFREAWRRFGRWKGPGRDVELDLRLRFPAGVAGPPAPAPSLAAQIREAVREAAAREGVFRPGRAYCYRCESSDCPHGAPAAPQKVFSGYSSTGQPRWPDFSQLLIEKRHGDAAAVFDPGRRGLSSIFLPGEELRSGQLAVFGGTSKTYVIHGQVALGFLRTATPAGEPVERAALTVQAVEVRGDGGRPRLALNVLGRLPDGTETMESLEDWRHERLVSALSSARRNLARLSPSVSRVRGQDFEEKVAGILKRMARSLQRTARQGTRRTDHAEARRRQQRPTAKAVEDAAAATDDRRLRDDREGTVVVMGPLGRIHFFSPEGRHVTSLNMRREEIDGRVRRRRWQPLQPPVAREFKKRIAALRQRA
jgi:hypothetical protein